MAVAKVEAEWAAAPMRGVPGSERKGAAGALAWLQCQSPREVCCQVGNHSKSDSRGQEANQESSWHASTVLRQEVLQQEDHQEWQEQDRKKQGHQGTNP